jgi:hypothetical protein
MRPMFDDVMSILSEKNKLKEENTKLKRFFFAAMEMAYDGSDFEGSDMQDFAETIKLGHFEGEDSEIFKLDIDK